MKKGYLNHSLRQNNVAVIMLLLGSIIPLFHVTAFVPATTRTTTCGGTSHIGSSFKKNNHHNSANLYYHQARATTVTKKNIPSFVALKAADLSIVPRISNEHLNELSSNGYVIIPNFLPQDLQTALRDDVETLRKSSKFKIAKIGQDSTNTLNENIRIAETCFLGASKLSDVPNAARNHLYKILDQIRQDLPQQPLDATLSELLYAYYPRGGFYRRHRDAIAGSASVLRKVSLLLYLNQDWTEQDGGKLRMHMDSGGDFLPDGEEPNYIDVEPQGGTLVLFQSDKVPHEVLDTQSERLAVVGWYNRPVSPADIAELSGGGLSPVRIVALGVAAALVTVGLVNLL